MPEFTGIHHVAITVTDVDQSLPWYRDVLGLVQLMEEKHPDGGGQVVVLAKPDFSCCIGLHTHNANERERFLESRTGLDHFSLGVASRDELGAWEQRLTELGVEHSPITDREGFSVLVFRDPDNIQLEFISFG